MNLWYEQWSKAGAGPNFRIENPEIYILKFNWVPNWFEMYFFTKVSDNIFVIILVSLITYLILSFKNKRQNNYKYKYLLFYILLDHLIF